MKVIAKIGSLAALHKLAEQVASGNMYLTRDLGLARFAAVDVDIESPDDERFSLACEVLQTFPGTATALTVKPSSRNAVDALLAYAMKQPPTGDAAAASEIVVEDEDGEDEAARVGDVSVAHQLAAMSLNEKRQAALHGARDVRLWLLKDHNKTLHPFVMKNPALSIDEVEMASRMTNLHPDVLHVIAKDWARSSNIVRNLVRNPKTPMPDALALIDKLAPGDLRAIVKSGSVRNALLMAARKKLHS